MKVYVVLCYDDWADGIPRADIDKVFMNKNAAEAYAHHHDFDYSDIWYEVEEHEVIE